MSASDRELAARFVDQGDEEAFRLLFRRHTPRVYAVALRLLGGRVADAEDVVQETWLRAGKRIRAFEWRSSLSTWLIGIAVNCARELLRARPADADGVDASAGAAQAVVSVAVAIDLERAIAALSERHRAVLVLHDVEGWTHTEIAQALEIAIGTSKSDLSHARRAVRQRLRGDGPHERQ